MVRGVIWGMVRLIAVGILVPVVGKGLGQGEWLLRGFGGLKPGVRFSYLFSMVFAVKFGGDR